MGGIELSAHMMRISDHCSLKQPAMQAVVSWIHETRSGVCFDVRGEIFPVNLTLRYAEAVCEHLTTASELTTNEHHIIRLRSHRPRFPTGDTVPSPASTGAEHFTKFPTLDERFESITLLRSHRVSSPLRRALFDHSSLRNFLLAVWWIVSSSEGTSCLEAYQALFPLGGSRGLRTPSFTGRELPPP